MARFIVVPKMHGRVTTYEVIDTDANKDFRFRLGHHDDQNTALAVAGILNENRADYTAILARLDNESPF